VFDSAAHSAEKQTERQLDEFYPLSTFPKTRKNPSGLAAHLKRE